MTRDAAYFTNSLTPELYRVPVSRRGEIGAPETIRLNGPAADFGTGFNLNGIDATLDGRTLIVVNSATGGSSRSTRPPASAPRSTSAGPPCRPGDGILLLGRTLLVLQNGAQTG